MQYYRNPMRAGGTWIVIPVIAAGIGYMFWTLRGEPWPVMRVAGACLMVIGFALWSLARIQLGSSFSVAAKASVLVTHGLYSRIRNPIYVFGTMLIAGLCLFYEQPLYLLILVALVPMQIIRARKESAVLEAAFGEPYREYKRHTWF